MRSALCRFVVLGALLVTSLVTADNPSVEDSIDRLRQALVDMESSLRNRSDAGDKRLEEKLAKVERALTDLRTSLGRVDSGLSGRIRTLENQMVEIRRELARGTAQPTTRTIEDLKREIAGLRQDLDRLARGLPHRPGTNPPPAAEPPKPICTRFETTEAYNAIKACGTNKDTWYCVGAFMRGSESATCPGVGSYCFSRCVALDSGVADVCARNCRLYEQRSRCEDWELEGASQALAACARHGGNAWFCLQYFMVKGNAAAACRGMSAKCFSLCAAAAPGAQGCEGSCNRLR